MPSIACPTCGEQITTRLADKTAKCYACLSVHDLAARRSVSIAHKELAKVYRPAGPQAEPEEIRKEKRRQRDMGRWAKRKERNKRNLDAKRKGMRQ